MTHAATHDDDDPRVNSSISLRRSIWARVNRVSHLIGKGRSRTIEILLKRALEAEEAQSGPADS